MKVFALALLSLTLLSANAEEKGKPLTRRQATGSFEVKLNPLAAEMFALAGDRERAAQNYERSGRYSEAAELFALAGDSATFARSR